MDDSLSAFPRVWRQGDAAPNTAQLAEEDITKAAPTAKKLGAYPSQGITLVRAKPCIKMHRGGHATENVNRRKRRQEAGRLPQPGHHAV